MRKADRDRLDACSRHAPYVPLAEQIAAEVAAFKLDQRAAQDPVGVMGLITADMTEREIKALIYAKFDGLPAQVRAELLVNAFQGDAILHSRLVEERARQHARSQIPSNIAELREDARLYSKISLARIAQGAVVELFLYDESDYTEAESLAALVRDYEHLRYIRAASLGDGRLHLLEDETPYDDNADPGYEDHEIIDLGTALYDKRRQEVQFTPEIFAGTRVYADIADGNYEPFYLPDSEIYLAAGRISVNQQVIF